MESYYKVIIAMISTEKSLSLRESQNKLVFIVDRKADKKGIKETVEKLFNVEVENVRTYITNKGEKRAIVKLKSKFKASEIATKLGLI
ncbi:MAG: 50S ribosomal protein L23 [Candidatus Methanomethylicia archaeon]